MTKTFCLFIFSRAVGIRTFRLKREYIGNICISDELLNMCSEPFVMVLNVRAAHLAATFGSPFPRRLHIKFGFDWPSGFRGEDV